MNQCFRTKIHNLSVVDGTLWRETKQLLRYKFPSSPLIKADNTLAISNLEKAKVFQSHLTNIFQHIDNDIDNVRKYLDSPLPNGTLVKYITPNKVENIIKKHSDKISYF